MPYAAEGRIGYDPIPGGIAITDEQYQQALDGQIAGLHVQIINGEFFVGALPEPEPEPLPEPEPHEIVAMFRDSIQLKLDEQARRYGYDSIASAVTYAEEPAVPKFQAEGQAFRTWRSLVWAYGYEQLALVESGQRPAPTIPEFIAELPPLDLPAPITAGQE